MKEIIDQKGGNKLDQFSGDMEETKTQKQTKKKQLITEFSMRQFSNQN